MIPGGATLVFDVELLDINGKRSLGKYLLTLDSWVQGKLQKYDSDAATRAALDAKHGSRDEYVSHLYVLYPNVRQRTELICKCLEVLCDIVTHPGLDRYLRERQ